MNNQPSITRFSPGVSHAEGNSVPMFEDFPGMLTVQHLAEITGLSEQTIRREMHAGNIPSVRIGRRLFCSKSRFVEYIEGR